MKKLIILGISVLLFSCNNVKESKQQHIESSKVDTPITQDSVHYSSISFDTAVYNWKGNHGGKWFNTVDEAVSHLIEGEKRQLIKKYASKKYVLALSISDLLQKKFVVRRQYAKYNALYDKTHNVKYALFVNKYFSEDSAIGMKIEGLVLKYEKDK